jgi:hypothetical protein
VTRLLALGAIALIVAASSPPAALALEGDYEAAVTRVAVKLTARISSQDAHAGDRFEFDTSSSVQLEGEFLPAGTHGHGVVVAARSAHGPQPGLLTLDARSLDLPSGKAIAVGLAPGQLAIVLTGDRRSFPVPAAGAPPILLGGSRVTNIVYEKGTAFTVVAPPPPPTPEPAPSGNGAP